MSKTITELRKKGEIIPANVIADLRSAKTMIEISKVSAAHVDNLSKIEEYLGRVEAFILPAAKKVLGEHYCEDIYCKILEAYKSTKPFSTVTQRKFPVGIPRNKKWIRLKSSAEIPMEKAIELSDKFGLKFIIEDGGRIIIFGDEDKLKSFLEEVKNAYL